jgi:CMP-N,N'-diacetyllegionaminic acid synthase
MIADRRVLAVITARGGSRGVPGKNLKDLAGRPLLEWTIRAARQSTLIDRIIVSSDDTNIIRLANALECDAPFVRSAELASDRAQSIDVVIDAVDKVPGYDIVVLLQPTSPLRTAGDIDGTIELLSSSPAAVTATHAAVHPWLVFKPTSDGRLEPYSAPARGTSLRRQDLPPAVKLNGAVYAAEIGWLREHRTFIHRDGTRVWIMPAERSLDIDTPGDFEAAERILTRSAHTLP